MKRINERVVSLNDAPLNTRARYVLYWMQMYKRADHNHALTWAKTKANELDLPLVVYEGLKYYYPWASDRLHTFILEGVEEKKAAFERDGIRYIFYLQRDSTYPKRTVEKLASEAALIVTDDYPCYIIPDHNRAIAERAQVAVHAVDSNGVIPISRFEKEEYAAYTFRPKARRVLAEYLLPFKEVEMHRRSNEIEVECPETQVSESNIPALTASCDIDHSVPRSTHYRGGTSAARKRLRRRGGRAVRLSRPDG